MLASPSTHSSPIINITPTLVITSHGIWRDPDDSFELPIGINMVKATQIGVVNILDQKVSNSIPKLVEDANNLQTTPDKIAYYQRELNSLDNNNCRYSLSCKSQLKRTPTAIQCANEYESEGDDDAGQYLDQILTYDNIVKAKGSTMLNKSYELVKSDFKDKGKHNEYDDRMVLYLPDGSKKDILNNWMVTYNTRNIAESVIRNNRDIIETTLKDILEKIKEEYGLNDIIIIDLSCNSVDVEEDRQNHQSIERLKRNFIRTINVCLNSNFGLKTQKRKIQKYRC